jgi:hypothetical protein
MKIYFFVMKQELLLYTTCMHFIPIQIASHFYYFFNDMYFLLQPIWILTICKLRNDTQSRLLTDLDILSV